MIVVDEDAGGGGGDGDDAGSHVSNLKTICVDEEGSHFQSPVVWSEIGLCCAAAGSRYNLHGGGVRLQIR